MPRGEYVQVCLELEMIECRLLELPTGHLIQQKKGKYVDYYLQGYEKGIRTRKYIRKKNVETMEKLIATRKNLEVMKKEMLQKKEEYEKRLKKEGFDPEQILEEERQRRAAMEKHHEQKQAVLEADQYHNKKNMTLNHESVRSRAEVIIANILYLYKVPYQYEKEQWIAGEKIKPDFTIYYNGKVIYWEHAGLMTNENYRDTWDYKRRLYAKAGIIEGKNLIVTYEHEGIDSIEIRNLVFKYIFGW